MLNRFFVFLLISILHLQLHSWADTAVKVPFVLPEPDESEAISTSPYYDVEMLDGFNEAVSKPVSEVKQSEVNWNERSFWATIGGIIGTLITIIIMICFNKGQHKDTMKTIGLLEQQNDQTKTQIENQKTALNDSVVKNNNILAAMNTHVQEIKNYTMNKDVVLRLVEKKESVFNSYMHLWESFFKKNIPSIIDGTILKNATVFNAVLAIDIDITTITDLLPKNTDEFKSLSQTCRDDLMMLSKKRRKGENTSEWLKESKKHFEDFNNLLGVVIDNMRNNNK